MIYLIVTHKIDRENGNTNIRLKIITVIMKKSKAKGHLWKSI